MFGVFTRRARGNPFMTLFATTVLALGPAAFACAAAPAGLVAHWPLDDGAGTVAVDAGGRGYDAQIVGEVSWVEDAAGMALRLGGDGQHVVAPAEVPVFGGPHGGTVMLWFRPEGEPQGGLLGCTTGNTYAHGRLTVAYKKDAGDRFIQNLSDGETYDHGKLYPIPRTGYWNHCALTYDGREVCTYINGALVRRQEVGFTPDMAGRPLWIGRTGMWLGGPLTFRGLLREVYVLDRALRPEEVRAYVRDTGGPYGYSAARPTVQVEAQPASGRAVVSVEVGLLEDLQPESRFMVAVYRPGEAAPVADGLSAPLRNARTTEAVLDLQDVAPGPLNFNVHALDPAGEPVGQAGTTTLEWPEREGRFSPAGQVRILNNMVFELLNTETVASREHTFRNPRHGWVYLAVPITDGQSAQTSITLDGEPLALDRVGDRLETMRHLPEGEYRLSVTGAHGPQHVIARSIGGLYYMVYGASGHLERAAGITGAHDWEFLRRHVLDHTNTIVALPRAFDDAEHEEELRWWHDRGRQWNDYFHVPGENVLENLRGRAALRHPLVAGGWIDEFGMRHRPVFDEWAQAMQALREDPQTADRTLYLYFMGLNSAMGPLLSATCKTGNRVGIEWYLRPYPTEAEMEAGFRPHEQRAWQQQWFHRVGGGEDDCRVIALGIASQGSFSWDMYPHVDFRVFYDRQFQVVATEPAFFGIRGIQGWWSTHAGQEMIRLQAQLMRHYFIEGRTDRFLSDPYILTHVQNPDFAHGTEGWDLHLAEAATGDDPGSMQPRNAPLFGQLQGRALTYYVGHHLQASRAPLDLGDTALWTRRSDRAPNRFSQVIRDLEPGRLYSLRWFTADYQDLVQERSDSTPLAISPHLEGVQMVDDPELCYDYVQPAIPSWSGARIGAFDREKPYYVSGYHRVFRAEGTTARLTLSDWAAEDAPGGPAGQELIWNFISVRPYLAAEGAGPTTPSGARPDAADYPTAGSDEQMPRLSGLLFNQDCTDFFYVNAITEDVDGGALLDQYVDLLADAGVTVLMWNTNARRTNYRSQVWESFWEGYDPEGPDDQPFLGPIRPESRPNWRRMIHSMWALDRQGVDYPARAIARCREHGISPWISLRMNDVHENDNLEHPFHGALWRQERYFRGGGGYYGRGLDYAHAKVRDAYRALIEETLQRFDIDGLELDFMREPYLFRPGAEQEGAEILHQWMQDVRRLVDEAARERGRPILLGVRVPSRVEVAQGWGLDAVAWAEEGLVDLVVATPRWATLEYDMPLDEWKQALEDSGVTLAGGLEILHRPVPGGPATSVTPDQAAGAAAAVLNAGADAVYLFNYFGTLAAAAHWQPDWYRRTLRAMSSLEAISALPRRHAVTWRDITGPQEAYRAPLPAEGTNLAFELATGPPPAEGAEVTLMVHVAGSPATPEASVNGVPCPSLERRERGEHTVLVYQVPHAALPGNRRDTVALAAGEALQVRGVEVRIAPE